MDTTEKKVSPVEVIIQMLAAQNQNRLDAFYKSAEEYFKTLPTSSKYYWRLKNALREKKMNMIELHNMPHNIKNLLLVQPEKEENVYLNEDIKSLIEGLTKEWNNIQSFRYHNLTVRNKILLHGTTGNGKTTVARHIAKLANLPFIEVKSDIVIDSHLGTTGGNIHNILSTIKQPCVLFWDEVDSIGFRRGGTSDNSAQNENDRMTNSILTNLDKIWDEVIFIAATNRKDILDSAFLRRFDVTFEIPNPTDVEKELFTKQQFEYYKIPSGLLPSDYSRFVSYAEIKQHILTIARQYVLENLIINDEQKSAA